MIFVIGNLKYNTDNMELISEKCKYTYKDNIFRIIYYAYNVKLWKSKKNNWLVTYTYDKKSTKNIGVSLSESYAKELLLRYDLEAYEKLFDELEEA